MNIMKPTMGTEMRSQQHQHQHQQANNMNMMMHDQDTVPTPPPLSPSASMDSMDSLLGDVEHDLNISGSLHAVDTIIDEFAACKENEVHDMSTTSDFGEAVAAAIANADGADVVMNRNERRQQQQQQQQQEPIPDEPTSSKNNSKISCKSPDSPQDELFSSSVASIENVAKTHGLAASGHGSSGVDLELEAGQQQGQGDPGSKESSLHPWEDVPIDPNVIFDDEYMENSRKFDEFLQLNSPHPSTTKKVMDSLLSEDDDDDELTEDDLMRINNSARAIDKATASVALNNAITNTFINNNQQQQQPSHVRTRGSLPSIHLHYGHGGNTNNQQTLHQQQQQQLAAAVPQLPFAIQSSMLTQQQPNILYPAIITPTAPPAVPFATTSNNNAFNLIPNASNSMVTPMMQTSIATNNNNIATATGGGLGGIFPDPRQFIMGKLPVNNNNNSPRNINRSIKKQQRRSFTSGFKNKPPSPPLRSKPSAATQKAVPRRRGSTGTSSGVSKHKVASVVTADTSNKSGINPDGDPEADKKMLEKLKDLMTSTEKTQKQLQEWDRDQGLPKSHSQTMVNTSRSRKQIQDGVILAKWDGSPLISEEVELGKARPRRTSAKAIPVASTKKYQYPAANNQKMIRRLSS